MTQEGRVHTTIFGLGGLFLFLGYFGQCYISETVIHSIYTRYPDVIGQHDGYYSQALQFGVFAVSCILSPALARRLTSKGSLVLTSLIFTVFHLGFLHVNRYVFFATEALVGLGYALFNVAEGMFLAEHSTKSSLDSNMAIETVLSHVSQLFSGGLLYAAASFSSSQGFNDIHSYSDAHIRVTYASFVVVSIIGLIFFAGLPKHSIEGSLQSTSTQSSEGAIEQIVSTLNCIRDWRMILFMPASIYQGAFNVFFLSVYPTSFSFTHSLSSDPHLAAIFCSTIGIGVIIGGSITHVFGKRIRNFSLIPSAVIHMILMILCFIILQMTTAEDAFSRPTDGVGMFYPCNRAVIITVALLVGVADCFLTTSRGVAAQLINPSKRLEIFSITKLFQALAGCVIFIISPHLTATHMVTMLCFLLSFGFVSFVLVFRQLRNDKVQFVRTDSEEIMQQKSQILEVPHNQFN